MMQWIISMNAKIRKPNDMRSIKLERRHVVVN